MLLKKIYFIPTLLILISSCKKDSLPKYSITQDGIGEFRLFDSIKTKYRNTNIKKLNGNESAGLIISNDTIYYVNKVDKNNNILEVKTTSPRVELPNGIKVGMRISELARTYPNIKKSVIKIPILNITTGSYIPSEYKKWRSNALTYQGIVLELIEKEINMQKDTILASITVKANLLQ